MIKNSLSGCIVYPIDEDCDEGVDSYISKKNKKQHKKKNIILQKTQHSFYREVIKQANHYYLFSALRNHFYMHRIIPLDSFFCNQVLSALYALTL